MACFVCFQSNLSVGAEEDDGAGALSCFWMCLRSELLVLFVMLFSGCKGLRCDVCVVVDVLLRFDGLSFSLSSSSSSSSSKSSKYCRSESSSDNSSYLPVELTLVDRLSRVDELLLFSEADDDDW